MGWREREGYDEGEDWWNEPDEPVEAPPAAPSTPPWTDPDNAPPSWLYDPNAAPPSISEPGLYWAWNGTMWETRQVPRAPQKPVKGPTADAPPIIQPGGGEGTGGGGGGGGFSGPDYGDFQWPEFNAPRIGSLPPFSYQDFSYPEFSYESFAAPTMEDAANEPGFKFSLEQGQKALENSAAARGTLRTGGTFKDLISWGQKAADQNYGNVYNRAANTYTMNRENAGENYDRNRGNAFGNWSGNLQKELSSRGINWGELTDTYDRNYQASKDEFNPRFRAAELKFEDLYRRFRDQGDWTTRIATGAD